MDFCTGPAGYVTSPIVLSLALAVPAAASAQDNCKAIAAARFPQTTIVSASMLAANGEARTPAFCEVRVTIAPVDGSRIGAVYRLPSGWNGKVLGVGGGGAAGNLTLQAATNGLSRGYAVIQNDL